MRRRSLASFHLLKSRRRRPLRSFKRLPKPLRHPHHQNFRFRHHVLDRSPRANLDLRLLQQAQFRALQVRHPLLARHLGLVQRKHHAWGFNHRHYLRPSACLDDRRHQRLRPQGLSHRTPTLDASRGRWARLRHHPVIRDEPVKPCPPWHRHPCLAICDDPCRPCKPSRLLPCPSIRGVHQPECPQSRLLPCPSIRGVHQPACPQSRLPPIRADHRRECLLFRHRTQTTN